MTTASPCKSIQIMNIKSVCKDRRHDTRKYSFYLDSLHIVSQFARRIRMNLYVHSTCIIIGVDSRFKGARLPVCRFFAGNREAALRLARFGLFIFFKLSNLSSLLTIAHLAHSQHCSSTTTTFHIIAQAPVHYLNILLSLSSTSSPSARCVSPSPSSSASSA